MPTEKKSAATADRDSAIGLLVHAIKDYSESVTRFGGTLCDTYLLIALSDEVVQKHFINHAKNEFFAGARCLPGPRPVDQAHILFAFRVLPPAIRLLPVFFLVTINTLTGKVVEVIDPHPSRPL
jgi:hypothetical protein